MRVGDRSKAFFALDDAWRFTFADDGAAALFDRQWEHLEEEVIWDAVDGAEAAFRDTFATAATDRTSLSFRTSLPGYSGTIAGWVHPSNGGVSVSLTTDDSTTPYGTLLDAIPDAVVTVDEDGTVVEANRAVEPVFGYDPETLLGESVTELLPDGTAERHLEGIARSLDAGEGAYDRQYVEFTASDADGTELPIAASINGFEREGKRLFTGVLRDISEWKARESKLEAQRDLAERRRTELESLVGIGSVVIGVAQSLVGAEYREEIDDRVCERLAAADHWTSAWTGTVDDDGTIEPRVAAGVDVESLPEFDDPGAGVHSSPIGRAVEYGETAVVQNVGEDADGEWHAALAAAGARSCVAIPLGAEPADDGVLVVRSERPHAFSGRERELLTELADTVVEFYDTVENREKYRSVVTDALDGAPGVGVVVLDETGTVRLVNEPVETFFGVGRATIEGVRMRDLVEEQLSDRLTDDTAERLIASYEGETTDEQFECRIAAAGDSDERWLEHRVRPVTSGFYAGGRVGFYYDITDRKRNERELERYNAIVDSVGDAVFQLDTDGTIERANDAAVALSGYDGEELVGGHISELLGSEDLERAEGAIDDLAADEEAIRQLRIEIRTSDGGTVPVECRTAGMFREGTFAGVIGVARDVSGREARKAELERLTRVNAIVRDLLGSLVHATTRDELDRKVCERLAEWDAYRVAWIGETDPADDGLAIRAVAPDVELEQDTTFPLDDGATETAARCVEQDAVAVNSADATLPFEVEGADVSDGAAAAVPITYEDLQYGVLGVYATDQDTFTDLERTVLAELGHGVGFAYSAIDRRRALLGDSVTELRFRLPDALPTDMLSGESEGADGPSFALDLTVPTGDGPALGYVSTESVSEETVRAFAEHTPDVESTEAIDAAGGNGRYEIRFSETPFVTAIIDYGGRIRELVVDGGDLVAVADLPKEVDVRSVVAAVQEAAPEAELAAKQTVFREEDADSVGTGVEGGRLTEKQRTAIEAAYNGGYFEWPRENDGEEIAESLDISSSTFHQHLRAAERKTFAELVADDEP